MDEKFSDVEDEMEELDEHSHTSEDIESESSTEEARETIRDKVNDIFVIN